jgi:hypothetical protein
LLNICTASACKRDAGAPVVAEFGAYGHNFTPLMKNFRLFHKFCEKSARYRRWYHHLFTFSPLHLLHMWAQAAWKSHYQIKENATTFHQVVAFVISNVVFEG